MPEKVDPIEKESGIDDVKIFNFEEEKEKIEEKAKEITKDQIECMGCLSGCKFSNWSTNPETNYTTGYKPDPRSFCIQKTLQEIVDYGDVDNQLMFSGHNAYKFAQDDFYKDGFIPTTEELIERIVSGL